MLFRSLAFLAAGVSAIGFGGPPKHGQRKQIKHPNKNKNNVLEGVDPAARRAAKKLNKHPSEKPASSLEDQILYHAREIEDVDKKMLKQSQESLAAKGWCLTNVYFGEARDQNGFLAYACTNPTAVTSRPMRFDTHASQDAYASLPSPASGNVDRVMFIVGGNAMIASDFVGPITKFINMHSSSHTNQAFFIADLPGYSGNGQKPSPASALAVDLSAANKLKSYFPNPNLKFNFLGHSLGCAVVTQLAAQPSIPTDRLILSAPFQDTVRMAKVVFPSMPNAIINNLVHHRWNNTKSIQNLPSSSRLTILHSKADAVVPYTQGFELANLARAHGIRTKMETFPWGGHNEIFGQHFDALVNAMSDEDLGTWNDPELLQIAHRSAQIAKKKYGTKKQKKRGGRAPHAGRLPAFRP